MEKGEKEKKKRRGVDHRGSEVRNQERDSMAFFEGGTSIFVSYRRSGCAISPSAVYQVFWRRDM